MAGISRRTSINLAKVYAEIFARPHYRIDDLVGVFISQTELYDFFFQNGADHLFLECVEQFTEARQLELFIMHFHDGRSVQAVTDDSTTLRSQHALEVEGQAWLFKLTRWALKYISETVENTRDDDVYERYHLCLQSLVRSVELDGYTWEQGRIIELESDILEAKEERGLIRQLFSSLSLGSYPILDKDLTSSEEHYLNGKWDDCISNARQVLDLIIQELAKDAVKTLGSVALPEKDFRRAAAVREHLEKIGLVSTDEMKAIKEAYAFMSNTGSHPYIAAQDEARLARRMALVYCEFLLLRYRGKVAAKS